MVVQLPKQDLALTYCKHVDQRHHQSYEDFINARNEIALDIGYARECTYHVVSLCKTCFFFNENVSNIIRYEPNLTYIFGQRINNLYS